MPETWDTLNKINENIVYEYHNETEFSLEELEAIEWQRVSSETSKFSSMAATTYVNPEETIAKKVFSDGYVEYYELA
jgi:hypothetical protein